MIIRSENIGAYLGYLNLARYKDHAAERGSKSQKAQPNHNAIWQKHPPTTIPTRDPRDSWMRMRCCNLNLARYKGHTAGRGSKQLSATTAQSDKQFTKFFFSNQNA